MKDIWRTLREIGEGFGGAASMALLVVLGPFLRSKMQRWGATEQEASALLPADGLIIHPAMESTRAITIEAPPRRVWAWLVQIGQGRAGFYSYDALENLLGMNIHSSDRIVPELQRLRAGDTVPFWRGVGVTATAVVPPWVLVLSGTVHDDPARRFSSRHESDSQAGGTWVFLLEPLPGLNTRLIVRSRVAGFAPHWLCNFFLRLLEPVYFVMERKMLLGIKRRAEQSRLGSSLHRLDGALSQA
jgi:hypothetical protein